MERQVSIRLAALAAMTAAVVGCGSKPPVAPDTGNALKSVQISQGTAQMPKEDQQETWKKLLAEINTIRTTTYNLKCELTGYFVSIKDGKTGSTLADFAWQKPNTTSMVVQKSSDGATQGTKLVWNGGAQMKVKTKLLGFWLKTSVDIHNEYAKDQRGYFIDETGIGPTLDTLVDPRNQVTVQGTGQMDGLPIMKVGIKSPRSLKGVSNEVYIIDTNRKVPVVREMYDTSNKLVFRIKMDKLVLNSKLPADTFVVE
jgi:hypothetical protein